MDRFEDLILLSKSESVSSRMRPNSSSPPCSPPRSLSPGHHRIISGQMSSPGSPASVSSSGFERRNSSSSPTSSIIPQSASSASATTFNRPRSLFCIDALLRPGAVQNGSAGLISNRFLYFTLYLVFFKKMCQSRPLFVYFRSFHTPIQMTNTN